MWAFFNFGLLMPALVPEKVREQEDVLAWTNNGEYDLQVRGRLEEHLQYFMDNFMEEGTFNPTIHATPQMDYNFRFYTTVEAYAEGIKQAALAMDYEKFKTTSERFSWNKKYHSILNRIWATVCDLNEPGGFYGPKSDSNPNGYTSRYNGWGGYYGETWDDDGEGYYTRRHNQVTGAGSTYTPRVGDSFGPRDDDMNSNVRFSDSNPNSSAFFADRGDLDDELDTDDRDSLEFVPESERKMYEIIDSFDEYGIPPEEWWSYASPREFTMVEPVLLARFGKKVLRSMRKKNRKASQEHVQQYT